MSKSAKITLKNIKFKENLKDSIDSSAQYILFNKVISVTQLPKSIYSSTLLSNIYPFLIFPTAILRSRNFNCYKKYFERNNLSQVLIFF